MEMVDTLVNSLDRKVFAQLALTARSDGKLPIDLTDNEILKQKLQNACGEVETSFKTGTKLTALVFSVRVGVATDEHILCEFFEKRGITAEVHYYSTELDMLEKIKSAAEIEDSCGLIVAVVADGSQEMIHLGDEQTLVQSIIKSMSTSSMLRKPKVFGSL